MPLIKLWYLYHSTKRRRTTTIYYVQDQIDRWWKGVPKNNGYLFYHYTTLMGTPLKINIPYHRLKEVVKGERICQLVDKHAWRFLSPLEPRINYPGASFKCIDVEMRWNTIPQGEKCASL